MTSKQRRRWNNVNILFWIITCRGCCFISVAAIVQQNSSRWFHIESSSSMWFLVPRSRPLEWVIVKVQASNQDSPDWVTVQRLLTAVPSHRPTPLNFPLLLSQPGEQLEKGWLLLLLLLLLFVLFARRDVRTFNFPNLIWISCTSGTSSWLMNVQSCTHSDVKVRATGGEIA